LKAVYGREGVDEGLEKGGWWCVAARRFTSGGYVRSMHIVPMYLGEEGVAGMFCQATGMGPKGKGRDALYDVRNGLLLHVDVAEAFEAFRLTIVPSSSKDEKGEKGEKDEKGQGEEYEIFVLDETLMRQRLIGNGPLRFGDLHGQALEFRDVKERPERRYLYFMFVVAVAVCERRTGRAASILAKSGKSAKIWNGCESYVERGTLRKLVEYIAHDGGRLGFDEALGQQEEEEGAKKVGAEAEARKLDDALPNTTGNEPCAGESAAQDQLLRDIAARFVIRAAQAEEVDSDEAFTSESD